MVHGDGLFWVCVCVVCCELGGDVMALCMFSECGFVICVRTTRGAVRC